MEYGNGRLFDKSSTGKFSSQNYPIGVWKLPRHCPWQVDISKLTSRSEVSSTEFAACIELSELNLVLPSSIYNQFSSSSNSSDLTIALSNGLEATVASSLVSMRPVTDPDQSPILGAPFLSQVYLYADYQEKTLSVYLANNTVKILMGGDTLQCIEHSNSTGDLGWAVGSPTDLAASSSVTATATGKPSTGKSSGAAGRLEGGLGLLGVAVGLGV